jgi:hypothetical protein
MPSPRCLLIYMVAELKPIFLEKKRFFGCGLGNHLAIERALRTLRSFKICQTSEEFTNMTLDIIETLDIIDIL